MPTAPAEYRRIADELTAQIRAGDLTPGSKLPSTAELAEQYEVSVATAYRAVSLLHDRDLVVGQPGRGVYVADSERDRDRQTPHDRL
jgi:GntR family transcriptional regulator